MRRRACDAHGTDRRPAAGPRGRPLRPRGLDSARDLSVPRARDPVPCGGRPPDRPPAPAQPHRMDPPIRSAPACPPDRLGADRRCGLVVSDRGGDRAANPLRLAARHRVRLPGRPTLVAPLALGRGHRDRELRGHDRTEAVRSGAVSRRRTRTSRTPSSATRSESSSSTRASGSRSPSASSRASSPAPSRSSSAFADRSASSACR